MHCPPSPVFLSELGPQGDFRSARRTPFSLAKLSRRIGINDPANSQLLGLLFMMRRDVCRSCSVGGETTQRTDSCSNELAQETCKSTSLPITNRK